MTRLQDNVAVITGASSGFGRRIARAFAGEGAKVVVSDLREQPLAGGFEADLDKTTVEAIEQDGGTAVFVQCDVTDSAQVQKLIERAAEQFGRLDILVNNAGIFRGGKLMHEFSAEDLDACFNVNVKGTWFPAQEAVKTFLRQGDGGNIINPVSRHRRAAGPSPPIGLQHLQGRADQPHPLFGDRVRPGGHPRQRHLSHLREDRAHS